MGMDSTFVTSEPVVWLTTQERQSCESIIADGIWEEELDTEFETDRCDTFRELLEEFLKREINLEETELTVEILLYIIDKLYIKQQNHETIRLGFFISFEHHIGFLRRLVYLLESGGSCTFECWY